MVLLKAKKPLEKRMNQILEKSKIERWFKLMFPEWIGTRIKTHDIFYEAFILIPKMLETVKHKYSDLIYEKFVSKTNIKLLYK